MISKSAALIGKISAGNGLKARINASGVLVGSLSKPVGYIDYTGSYEVTPKASEQSLKTKDRHLTDDVTVKAIPFFETSNNSGGNTVYIGSEV